MTDIQIGDKAPDFVLPTNGGGSVTLSDYKGKMLVLYFYPKDDTPGCTKEAIAFTDHKEAFAALNTIILGVSRDTVVKHDKFIAKHDLTIDLGADETGKVTEDYGVWVEKNMYGKKYMGIERATYLIDEDGKIAEIWRKVRVKDHVQKVMDAVQARIKSE